MDTALHFSGGKDSLACLYLFRNEWDEILVCWVNTGAAYQETIELMDKWRAKLPHFMEIASNQPEQIIRHGYPADVVPVDNTLLAYGFGIDKTPRLQSYMDCCRANIWLPLSLKMKALGIKRVIRGQKDCDPRKAPIRHGQIFDGIEYVMPLQEWTDEQVFQYLREVNAEVPAYYAGERTSHDCWDCTAYLEENAERIGNLPLGKREVVLDRLWQIREAVSKSMEHMTCLSET